MELQYEVNKMLTDYHVHTYYSDDSDYQMEDVVKDAAAMGLDEICFTDHVDYGVKRDWDDPRGVLYRIDEPNVALANVDYEKYFKEYSHLAEKYGADIKLKLGLEFGMQRHTIPDFEKLYKRYPFDFIILSVHQINDTEFWTGDYQKGKTQEEYIMEYYEELLYLVKNYHNYSVLGHLDLISRYDTAGRKFPFKKIKTIVTDILKTVIADGKGIEINTSWHRYGLSDVTPSTDIIELYRLLGGEIITIGSDSHKPEHLGTYIDEAKSILKELGFKQYCTYEKMKPVFHNID